MHKKLFIPGPTEVFPHVLEAMATPMIGHRMKEFTALMDEVVPKVQKVFYTNNFIILSTSSGTGMMEAAVRCCVNKKALHTVCGAFSKRWAEISKSNGKEYDVIEVPLGKAIKPEMVEEKLKTGQYDTFFLTHNESATGVMHPLEPFADLLKKYPDIVFCVDAVSSAAGVKIEVDKLGIDFLVTSSQKCFALPPGLAIAVVSDKALKRAETVKNRGYYFDILQFKKYWDTKNHQTHTTPTISHIYALNKQLDKILNEEGLENRFKRHIEMANFVRKWVKENFKMFPEEGYESITLTTGENTRGISIAKVNEELAKRGAAIANGYGDLKEKTFRIAHMGDLTMNDMKWLIEQLDDILKKM